ncbi:acyl-CoA dehydrogenase family protein [Phytohabitans sp. ZYX-F-186]|uniref:Acyl-CoA dehydrogenase family protein n=1 Tax=Phytohabitans maris TaxID=3071409 RepID=A0ABU0ZV35_9ACTN|nr:acyl-CoA dehydrogenase family protein [Phytohabitans sp. ZYX-F-186]MDQ7910808.1 acyl-CoA dehydrogenase family protein [Phytohabitans sp. ZYX-F-186]
MSEDLESYRLAAREWLAANLPTVDGGGARLGSDDEAWQRARELQRILHDGGYAGIAYPKEYGGRGLTPAHQRVFNEESAGYEMPLLLNVPTFSICAPAILDFGTEEQKREHLPAVLRGDEVLVQFLSEPRGGSDLAGAITRATRDGDMWVLNGSKIWSSGAYAADYGICLARTDWEAPKHSGLTMFIVKVHQPGVEVRRIKQVNGDSEFCQEFFDDVQIPASDVLGEVNGGWAVASRLLFHERTAVGGGSPYVSGGHAVARVPEPDLVELARRGGRLDDPGVRELIAESHILRTVAGQLVDRVSAGIRGGAMPDPAASLPRLFSATSNERRIDIALAVAGPAAVIPPAGAPGDLGARYLMRQGGSLGGGSSEMARNIISERVLGMPREFAADKGVPFSQVRQSQTPG